MKKILVHMCCGPCATYVNKWLGDNGFDVRGLFYNPNIRPRIEYERRAITAKFYGMAAKISVISEGQDREIAVGDCEGCYRVRLRRTAELAQALVFDSFTTTLLISPYQKHDLIRKIGEEAGAEFGVKFYYRDFRDGYRESRRMAREMKLYMQKYCGCGEDIQQGKESFYAQAD